MQATAEAASSHRRRACGEALRDGPWRARRGDGGAGLRHDGSSVRAAATGTARCRPRRRPCPGNLIRMDQQTPDDIAGQHEHAAQDRHPGNGAAHVVAQQQADGIGHDQAQERDAAGRHHHDGGNRRHDEQARQHQARMVQAQVGGEFPAHAGHGVTVRRQVGGEGQAQADPQQLVAAAQHAREIARGPGVQRLQQVIADRDEGGGRVDHAAQDQPDQRHDEGRAQRHAPQQRQEQQRAGQGEGGGRQHLADDGRIGRHQRHRQDAQRGRFHGAGRARFHIAVAHQHLHDEPGNRQRHAGQQQRQRARHPADQQQAPGALGLGAAAQRVERQLPGAQADAGRAQDQQQAQQDRQPGPAAGGFHLHPQNALLPAMPLLRPASARATSSTLCCMAYRPALPSRYQL